MVGNVVDQKYRIPKNIYDDIMYNIHAYIYTCVLYRYGTLMKFVPSNIYRTLHEVHEVSLNRLEFADILPILYIHKYI